MSKERELLKRVLEDDDDGDYSLYKLYEEITKLLAQPEQEPVAWMWTRTYSNDGYTNKVFEFKTQAEEYAKDSENLKRPDSITPLYTSPPTREPLSDDAIHEIFQNNQWKSFLQIARILEIAHGIGVEINGN